MESNSPITWYFAVPRALDQKRSSFGQKRKDGECTRKSRNRPIYSDCSQEIKKRLILWRKAMTNPDSVLKSRHHFANKGPYGQSYGFSSSHIQMWELDQKEGWVPKNWCFWPVLFEHPLDSKEIKQSILKEINPE